MVYDRSIHVGGYITDAEVDSVTESDGRTAEPGHEDQGERESAPGHEPRHTPAKSVRTAIGRRQIRLGSPDRVS
jgi:hypothetical protein